MPLLRSCPFPVRHLLDPPGIFQLSRKYERLLQHLEERDDGDEDRFVLFLDAFDVQWMGCRRQLEMAPAAPAGEGDGPTPLLSIEEVFRSFGKPLFFSAEFGLSPFDDDRFLPFMPSYPDPQLPSCAAGATESAPCRPILGPHWHQRIDGYNIPDPKAWPGSSPYRFLNSGCFGGTAGGLRRFLRTVLTDPSYWRSEVDHMTSKTVADSWAEKDGLAATNYLLRNPAEVALDYGADICLSAHGLRMQNFKLDLKTREIRTELLFNKPVCFMHANGPSKMGRLMQDLSRSRRRGVQPKLAWSTKGYLPFASYHTAPAAYLNAAEQEPAAIVDTGQCLRGSGVLDLVSLCTTAKSFEGLQVQLWRPVPRRRWPNTSWSFRLVAQTDPLSTRGYAPTRFGGLQTVDSYEFELYKYRMRYEDGDCLGWLSLGPDIVFTQTRHWSAPALVAWGRPQVGLVYQFITEIPRHYCIFLDFSPD